MLTRKGFVKTSVALGIQWILDQGTAVALSKAPRLRTISLYAADVAQRYDPGYLSKTIVTNPALRELRFTYPITANDVVVTLEGDYRTELEEILSVRYSSSVSLRLS